MQNELSMQNKPSSSNMARIHGHSENFWSGIPNQIKLYPPLQIALKDQ